MTIVARYELISPIAEGALATVYLARQLDLDRVVALKELHVVAGGDAVADGQRFLREARTATALSHPNIVSVHEVFELEGSWYIAMEYVDGGSLREWMGRMTLSQIAGVLEAVLAALAYAARRGVLHGGLKPGNVLVTAEGRVMVADFGRTTGSTSRWREPEPAPGTVAFLAPEQVLGNHPPGPSTDLYTVGLLAYEMLVGQPPFGAASSPAATLLRRLTETVPPAHDVAPRIDLALSNWIAWLLATDPSARPQSANGAWAQAEGIFARLLGANWRRAARLVSTPEPRGAPPTPAPWAPQRPESPPRVIDGSAPSVIDENVQFTVYRPVALQVEVWHTVLAFAHVAAPRHPSDRDPIAEVERQARALLGPDSSRYRHTASDSRAGVPLATGITLRLDLPGCLVDPEQRRFRWLVDVHREEFKVRAPADLAGQTIRGMLSVFMGSLLIADVPIACPAVAEAAAAPVDRTPTTSDSARPYRRVFASYSRADVAIVEHVVRMASLLGDDYLLDVTHLRSGESWDPRLLQMIDGADVFQLFWSRCSMRSSSVRREWEHALALTRPHFVRPTYWEHPCPEDPESDLPPAALRALHFQRLPLEAFLVPYATYEPRSWDDMPAPGAAYPAPPPEDPSAFPMPSPTGPSAGYPPPSADPARRSSSLGCFALVLIVIAVALVVGAVLYASLRSSEPSSMTPAQPSRTRAARVVMPATATLTAVGERVRLSR